jgi:cob(I)alamin adenosyltransferase
MIHLYTGNGKGKTTAALGLCLRAAGSGMKVFIGQFVKGMLYNEASLIANRIPEIKLELLGRDCFIERTPVQADFDAARAGLEKVKHVIASEQYDLIVLDELNIALYYKLLTLQEILELLDHLPSNLELIITGRYAPPELIEKADLVTEMKEVKHYFTKGIEARKGIEW